MGDGGLIGSTVAVVGTVVIFIPTNVSISKLSKKVFHFHTFSCRHDKYSCTISRSRTFTWSKITLSTFFFHLLAPAYGSYWHFCFVVILTLSDSGNDSFATCDWTIGPLFPACPSSYNIQNEGKINSKILFTYLEDNDLDNLLFLLLLQHMLLLCCKLYILSFYLFVHILTHNLPSRPIFPNGELPFWCYISIKVEQISTPLVF